MTTVNLSQQALDELVTRLRHEIRLIVQQELRDALQTPLPSPEKDSLRLPTDLPVLDIGPWPETPGSLRREEIYGDDGR